MFAEGLSTWEQHHQALVRRTLAVTFNFSNQCHTRRSPEEGVSNNMQARYCDMDRQVPQLR